MTHAVGKVRSAHFVETAGGVPSGFAILREMPLWVPNWAQDQITGPAATGGGDARPLLADGPLVKLRQ